MHVSKQHYCENEGYRRNILTKAKHNFFFFFEQSRSRKLKVTLLNNINSKLLTGTKQIPVLSIQRLDEQSLEISGQSLLTSSSTLTKHHLHGAVSAADCSLFSFVCVETELKTGLRNELFMEKIYKNAVLQYCKHRQFTRKLCKQLLCPCMTNAAFSTES